MLFFQVFNFLVPENKKIKKKFSRTHTQIFTQIWAKAPTPLVLFWFILLIFWGLFLDIYFK
jgi:hypothetical protein